MLPALSAWRNYWRSMAMPKFNWVMFGCSYMLMMSAATTGVDGLGFFGLMFMIIGAMPAFFIGLD